MLANETVWLQGTTCRRCHQTGRDGRLTNPNLKEQSQPVQVRHAYQAHVGSSQCAKEVRAVPPRRRNSYHVDFSKRGCTTLRWSLQLGQHMSGAAIGRSPASLLAINQFHRHAVHVRRPALDAAAGVWAGEKSCGLRGSARAAPRGRGRKKQKHL